MSKTLNFLIKLVISLVSGVIAGILVFIALSNMEGQEFSFYRKMSDSCFIASILLISFALLTWLTAAGAFDFITYIFFRFKEVLSKRRENIAYSTYVRQKHENKAKFPLHIVVPGIIFLIFAIIFAIF